MARKKARSRLVTWSLCASVVVIAATAILHGPTRGYLYFVWAFEPALPDVPGVVAYRERTTGERWWLFEPRFLSERDGTSTSSMATSSMATTPDLLEAYAGLTGTALLLQQRLFPPRPQPGRKIRIGLPDRQFPELFWFTTKTFSSPSGIRRQLEELGAVFTAVHSHRDRAMQIRLPNPQRPYVDVDSLPTGLLR